MKLRYRIAAFIIRIVWKLFFGFRIEGIENIPPKGRLIVAANHRSNYDPPLIGAAAGIRRELFYFAKLGLFTPSKWFAWLIRSFNAYPVDTTKFDLPALRKTGHLLERELALLYFPEGTRNRTPLDFLPAKPGLGYIAKRYNAPILPTLIIGTNIPLWRLALRRGKVKVIFGQLIDAELLDQFPNNKQGYIAISQLVMDKIKEMYIRETQHQ